MTKIGRPPKIYELGDKSLTMVELIEYSGKTQETLYKHLARMRNGELTPGQVLGDEPIPWGASRLRKDNVEARRVRKRLDQITAWGKEESRYIL